LYAVDFAEFGGSERAPELGGAYDVRELFAEVQLPLLHDRPLARDIALNIGLRWSDFSSFDENKSWQAGLRWQLAEQLTLRANYAEVFRAPSIVELYGARWIVDGFWEFDPCGNEPTPRQRANCAANGVPDGAYVQGDEPFLVPYGGNPDLEPEMGHTFGAGVTYTPVWANGLSASIDYFQVELRHSIGQAFPSETLFECAERGTTSICADIRRFPDGRVSQVSSLKENFGGLEVRGVDLAIGWSATTRLGDVSSSVLATHLDRWDVQPFPEGEVFSYAGTFDAGARPRWRAAGHFDWHFGPWMASYALEYIGSYSETVSDWQGFGIFFDPFVRRVDPVVYHDLETGFEFGSGVSVRAAITNVTDEDPPYLNIAPANTDVATYRLLGRSYFLELAYRFD
jgi:outer membrane receptor protein involved in Fe transport